MPIAPLPIVGFYNQQRFKQFDPSDAANWTLSGSETGKKKVAMYPSMGREHVTFLDQNQLIFPAEPRLVKKSVNYWYAVSTNKIFRIDANFNEVEITQGLFTSVTTPVWFTYIVTGASGSTITPAPTYVVFTDSLNTYIYREPTPTIAEEFVVVNDPNMPPQPTFIATFGNRIIVSSLNSSQAGLSQINLGGAVLDRSLVFTVAGAALFLQATGIIRQLGVLDNTLHIFSDFTTDIWQNIPSQLPTAGGGFTSLPWKNNASYNWDIGIADPNTLTITSGLMAWLAKNSNGLIQPTIALAGSRPQSISTQAIDVLLQRIINTMELNPIISTNFNSTGFFFLYENTLFYRFTIGTYLDTELLDYQTTATSIEYNFLSKTWSRCIEVNGQRNRIQRHVYFGNRHLVSVQGDNTVYEMSGAFYTNDITNPAATSPQASNAYLRLPFRYERVTPIIFEEEDYMENITKYIEIDMVFGETPYSRVNGAYANTTFIIAQASSPIDGTAQFLITESSTVGSEDYIIAESGNFPQLDEMIYYNEFKPTIEVFFSDDAGISFHSADVREFSQVGQYRWRMRWYELGTSYFRCYKLVCVSPVPIVILGGVQQKMRAQVRTV